MFILILIETTPQGTLDLCQTTVTISSPNRRCKDFRFDSNFCHLQLVSSVQSVGSEYISGKKNVNYASNNNVNEDVTM